RHSPTATCESPLLQDAPGALDCSIDDKLRNGLLRGHRSPRDQRGCVMGDVEVLGCALVVHRVRSCVMNRAGKSEKGAPHRSLSATRSLARLAQSAVSTSFQSTSLPSRP